MSAAADNAMPAEAEAAIDAALLDVLLHARGPVTADSLASRLCCAPEAVERELTRLEAAGCRLAASDGDRAVQLIESGLGVWADYVQWKCPLSDGAAAGARRVEVYRSTGSTQDRCRAMIESSGAAADGALAIADGQTTGRGRLGRRWLAPAGACAVFSRAVVRDGGGAMGVERLSIASAVAAARAIEAVSRPSAPAVRLKWPNDLMIDGRKIAGVLVEASPRGGAAVIGIGVNVSLRPDQLPAELRHRVTSLALCGVAVDRLAVLAETIAQLDAALGAGDDAAIVREWRHRNALRGDAAVFVHNGRHIRGHAIDLDLHDGLVVRCESGEIVHLPAATTSVEA